MCFISYPVEWRIRIFQSTPILHFHTGINPEQLLWFLSPSMKVPLWPRGNSEDQHFLLQIPFTFIMSSTLASPTLTSFLHAVVCYWTGHHKLLKTVHYLSKSFSDNPNSAATELLLTPLWWKAYFGTWNSKNGSLVRFFFFNLDLG